MRASSEFEATKESLPRRIDVNDLAGATGYHNTCSLGLRRRPKRSVHAANRNTSTVTRQKRKS